MRERRTRIWIWMNAMIRMTTEQSTLLAISHEPKRSTKDTASIRRLKGQTIYDDSRDKLTTRGRKVDRMQEFCCYAIIARCLDPSLHTLFCLDVRRRIHSPGSSTERDANEIPHQNPPSLSCPACHVNQHCARLATSGTCRLRPASLTG